MMLRAARSLSRALPGLRNVAARRTMASVADKLDLGLPDKFVSVPPVPHLNTAQSFCNLYSSKPLL